MTAHHQLAPGAAVIWHRPLPWPASSSDASIAVDRHQRRTKDVALPLEPWEIICGQICPSPLEWPRQPLDAGFEPLHEPKELMEEHYGCERAGGDFTRNISLPEGIIPKSIEATYDLAWRSQSHALLPLKAGRSPCR